jgi:hypothetical protein
MSQRMKSLYLGPDTALETVPRAKFFTFSLTMSIPLSSDAFNSSTLVFINSGP